MRKLIDFVALDIETTGFDFKENEIIEIGALRFVDGKIADRLSLFVKPLKPVSDFIKQLTHITDEDLASGIGCTEALKQLKEYVKNDVLVCHNSSFDIGFINTQLKMHHLSKLTNSIADTLTLSRIYLPFILNHKLITVSDELNIKLDNAHRAIYDAEATGYVLMEIFNFIDQYIPLQINNKLLEIANFADKDLSSLLETIVDYQKKNVLMNKKQMKLDFHNRNYIENKPAKKSDYSIEDIFGENGVFSEEFDNYEIREGQIEMAHAVFNYFCNDESLLVEAGTGVGKSLAYIIPSLLFSNKTGDKIIISTNTKNLQEQLFYKDLPAVRNCIGIPFKATLLKGRSNYICERKWQEAINHYDVLFSEKEAIGFMNLIVWKFSTKTGDISENSSFDVRRDGNIWKKVVADRHFCYGRRCPNFSKCYLMDIRRKAEESNLVIINHHLLLADMQIENSALGPYDRLIIDEAHNLPQLAPSELGISLSYADFNNFFQQLFSIRSKFQSGTLPSLKAAATRSTFDNQKNFIDNIEEAIKHIKDNKETFSDFFLKIGQLVDDKGSYGKLRIKNSEQYPFIYNQINKILEFFDLFSKNILKLKDQLSIVSSQVFIEYDIHLDNLDGILKRITEFHSSFLHIYNPNFSDNAFWLESFRISDPKYPNGVINYAPLNINQIMFEKLYKQKSSMVFTSATLAIRGVFKYYSSRMGLDLLDKDYLHELIVSSPFDYDKQSKVVIAGFLPDPKDKFFQLKALDIVKRSIKTAKTGTMILFTSYKDLNFFYEELSDFTKTNEIVLLAQDKGISRSAMLREFKENKNAVLLGTNSFWEGVDVPGDALELLILYKIPFMVPSDPIVEAYLDKLKVEGKDSFMHYMLPNALLKYRQGFGRLIRSKSDRGIVLVLDNRIVTKKYGSYFVDTVPAKSYPTIDPVEVLDYLGRWFIGKG